MGLIHLGIVGERREPILTAVREMGAEKIVLIGKPDQRDTAASLKSVLEPLGVETHIEMLEDDSVLLGMIRLVQRIVRDHEGREDDILVNLGAADKGLACATLSASFVAGVKTIDMPNDEIMFLPVLRFSYEETVSEAKLSILQAIEEMGGQVEKLKILADTTGIQESLASYHIRGGEDGKGLVELGLVETTRGHRGALTISLTPMGELLARGLAP